jgi:hypothetical protein
MAAKSLGDFIEIYKREHGCNPGIIETWYAAIEFAEANKPSHNTQRLSFLRSLWNRIIGKNDSRL